MLSKVEFVSGVWCLKNVSLLVLPPAVLRGHQATLLCQYDLEGAPLYSVKWYRGRFEFYRYSPSDIPPNKIFHYPGIHVDVSTDNVCESARVNNIAYSQRSIAFENVVSKMM